MEMLLCMVVVLCCAMAVPLAFADELQGLSLPVVVIQAEETGAGVMAAAGRNTSLFFGRHIVARGY